MIQSMTGFGKSSGTFNNKKVVVELRALNSKGLDLYIKLPALYKEREMVLRKSVGKQLDRGKIEVSISVDNNGEQSAYTINKNAVKEYYKAINEVSDEIGMKDNNMLSAILRLPDVLVSENEVLTEEEINFIEELTQKAVDELILFRQQEGKGLQAEFTQCIYEISSLLEDVPNFEAERIENLKQRLRSGLDEVKDKVDENRFEQELIFYIEKLDISEEKQRLKHHLDYFMSTMNSQQAAGKKLGFICQEIGREINTLGSKAQHVELQKIVVQMKDNLEKIKEQVLNTL